MIADGGKNVYHVVRNSTYPKGFCYTDNSKTFWNKDGHRETRDFTTRELIKIEIRIGKKHKEYVPTAQMVRGMAVNAFVSEAKIRGEEYEVTYYFTKGRLVQQSQGEGGREQEEEEEASGQGRAWAQASAVSSAQEAEESGGEKILLTLNRKISFDHYL